MTDQVHHRHQVVKWFAPPILTNERNVVSPENGQVYPSSPNPLNSRGLATSASDECEKLCEVIPQSSDSLPADPRLRALLAHWDSLSESFRESLFRQFSEAVVLQSMTQESSVTQYSVTQETIHSI